MLYHPWSQWTKVIFTERTRWEIKSSVNHEKIKILWRGLSASGNVEVVPIKKGRSLRKHQQTEAWGPGGVGEHGDWLGWAHTTVGASSLMKATVDKRGQTALWHFHFMDYERPSLRWRLHPHSRVMFVALSGHFSCMSHFLLLNVWIVHTTIAHCAASLWCHAASLQPPHLTLETQAVATEPSGGWFITCSLRLVPSLFQHSEAALLLTEPRHVISINKAITAALSWTILHSSVRFCLCQWQRLAPLWNVERTS